MFPATRSEIHATDDEIGAAELYHHESVLKTSLGGEGPAPWLNEIIDTLRRIEQNQTRMSAVIKRTSAVLENMRIAGSNVLLAKNTGSTSYCAKQKEVRCATLLVVVSSSSAIVTNDSFYFLSRLMETAQF